MQALSRSRLLAAVAIAAGVFGVASAAQARTDVNLSIGLGGYPVYVDPAPVYAPPQPVYVQPEPVYVQPQPAYVAPPTVYVRPGYYDHDDWRRAEWRRRHWRHHHEWERERREHRDWD